MRRPQFIKRIQHLTLLVYVAGICGLLVYSFALIDPNLTLINHPAWTAFRNVMVNFGYLNRYDSWPTYVTIVTALLVAHLAFLKWGTRFRALHIALATGVILLFAYPFLSHDFFNYVFDARIFTLYGKNPYTMLPADFYQDEWLRFMQWTHRRYPYGPTFLPITIVASYASMGIFILNYLVFKGLAVGAYVGSVWLLEKLKPRWGLLFATHPLIIVEGVVNAHNDMLAVFFGIAGVYYIAHNTRGIRKFAAYAMLAISGGIKYFTLPTIILSSPNDVSKMGHMRNILAAAGVSILIIYVSTTGALQPWYFLNLLVFIPYYGGVLREMWIVTAGLLLSYYPIIRFGVWEPEPGVNVKNIIFGAACVGQVVYIFWRRKGIRAHLTG